MNFYKKALDEDKVNFLNFGQMPNSDLSEAEKEIVMDSYIEFSGNVLPSMQKLLVRLLIC